MPNRLAEETSPYLLQHADNPVDWHPWGEEALERARAENRPILLSVGYSACHWCHVMAHESFEDTATARLMNEHFINIKVDREERPDLDRIYQAAHQLLMRRGGGWPLTMFLTPDQVPFFGGTYFPKEARHGLPGFKEVLSRVAGYLREHPDEVAEQCRNIAELLARPPEDGAPARVDAGPLEEARRELAGAFDERYGGFGRAPKFPHVSDLAFLLRLGARGDGEALAMAVASLRAMADGGLYDQIGGGFYRYSVDEQWLIPHFEKMLYDNGPLLALYAQAFALTGEERFREAAEGTAAWVLREMEAPDGGFYATLDADSEHEEGKFYLFTPEEMEPLLTHDQYQVAAMHWGLDQPPNFEGRWHLHVATPLPAVAAALGLTEAQARERLLEARAALFAARAVRVAPGRDEKRLTAWNGLMIRGLALAGRLLEKPEYVSAAERALDFVRRELYRDGRLLAVCKDGKARLPAYLDDYAFLLDGVLALVEARWRDGDLRFATELADTLLHHFEDEANGGFFFTADDHEPLVQRPKPFADESMPAGNGVAAAALARLAHLTGDLHYQEAAARTLGAAWPQLTAMPYAHGALLLALDEQLGETDLIVLRGAPEAVAPWLRRLAAGFHPLRTVVAVPPQAEDLPGLMAERRAGAAPVVAWRCVGTHCRSPVTELEALL